MPQTFPEIPLAHRADWQDPALAGPIAEIRNRPDRAELAQAMNHALNARAQAGTPADRGSRAIVISGRQRYTITATPTLSGGLRLRAYLNRTAQDGYDYTLHDVILAEAYQPPETEVPLPEDALTLRPEIGKE